jgi:hypothetical protein
MIQKLQDNRAVLLGAVAIFAIGLTTSGYVLGEVCVAPKWPSGQ